MNLVEWAAGVRGGGDRRDFFGAVLWLNTGGWEQDPPKSENAFSSITGGRDNCGNFLLGKTGYIRSVPTVFLQSF